MDTNTVTRRQVIAAGQATRPTPAEADTSALPTGVRPQSKNGLDIATAAPDVAPVTIGAHAAAIADTLSSRLRKLAATMPNAPAYHAKVDGTFVTTTWKGYAAQVEAVAKGLMGLDLNKGDTATIYAFNAPEWVQAELALNTIGAVSTGAYPDLEPSEVAHTVNDSGSRVVFVQNLKMWKKLVPVLGEMPQVEHFVIMEGEKPSHPKAMTWGELLAAGNDVSAEAVEKRSRAIAPNDTATLIYTSGTTGKPKGVMLSHENLAYTGTAFAQLAGLGPNDTSLCYLRLGHIADRAFSIAGPVTSGMSIYFTTSESLKKDLPLIRPTLMFGVPRVWDTVATGIEAKTAASATGIKGLLTPWLQSIGRAAAADLAQAKKPSGPLYALANRFVLSDILKNQGLDRLRLAVSGGGAMKPATAQSLANIGIWLADAYGQSETAGLISCNVPGASRAGTLGKPPKGVQIRIAENGEILMRGPNVCKGYYKNEAATAELIKDGWLHTGDAGRLEDGYLVYVGRTKLSGKLSNGEYINPEPIEQRLCGGVIDDAIAIFRDRNFVTAVIVLNEVTARRIADDKKSIYTDPKVVAAVRAQVTAANTQIGGYRRVKDFIIVDRPLTAGQDGEIGSTGKMKPFVIEQRFAPQIAAMYEAKSAKASK